MSFSKKDVIDYRLSRAYESFTEAQLLRESGKLFATINRLYYSAFYAISAYFVYQDLKAFTHSGLKSAFNKELVLTGIISKAEGQLFNQLFSYRQDGDYKDFVQFDNDQVDLLFPKVEALINHFRDLVINDSE